MTATIHSLDAARERARQRDGKFGHQHHAEPQGISLPAPAPAPDTSTFNVLDQVEASPAPASTQVKAERIKLPGYVDRRLKESVANCVYALRHPESFDAGVDEMYAGRLLNYLPGTDREEIKTKLASDLDYEELADDLIVTDQRNRGIDHQWESNGTVGHERDHYPGYRTPTVGSRYDPQATTADNAKSIRQDIKAAAQAGWIPADLTYSVRKHHHSSIGIEVKGLSTDQAWDEMDPNDPQNIYHQSEMRSGPAQELLQRLENLAAVYQRDASDSMTDYFDMNFYANATFDAPSPSSARWRAEQGR